MKYAFAILAGLVWGLLAALLGGVITRRALAKNTNGALMVGNLLRTIVDLAALGLIFVLRNVLPFDWRWMMIATVAALSIGLIVISFRLAGKK